MKISNKLLKKLNTALRLIVVSLLIYPFPIAIAQEVEVNEDFQDSTYQTGLTITDGNSASYIYTSEQNQYGTTGNSLYISSGTYTFEFSSDIDVYEIGFLVAAVNNSYTVKYYYSDNTDETLNMSGQSNSNLPTMYDDFYKSFTDYNANEANTDKFITKFEVTVSDPSLVDTLYWQYDDGLTQGIGAPTNLATTQNLHSGSVGVTWTAPTGYTNTPERYAVAFSNDNFQTTNYAVATSTNSGDTSYTFSKSYLTSIFTDLEVGDILYFKIRSDDDTNSLYSSWTDVVSYTIPDVASGPLEFSIQNTSYQGLQFSWTATDTGWASLDSYRIEYKLSSEETYTGIDITDTTATSYTIEDISAGTYDFSLYACTDSGFCHGAQAGPANNYVVNANTATTTTTIVYTLGPPMNPVVSQTYNVGVVVDWDEPNTGNATATSYELYYRTSAEDEVKIENITETEYTIPYANIPNGTYEFSIRAIDSINNVNSGYSTEPTLAVFNQKAQDDADAAAEEERKRKEREEAERRERERQAELQRQRDKNLSETGYSETDQERSDREYAEEQDRLAELQRQRDKNAAETGYSETDDERADREYKEEQARLAELERQRNANQAETGYFETDEERAAREAAELAAEKARIEEEIKNTVVIPVETDEDGNVVELTDEEQKAVEDLVNAIIEIQETVDFTEYDVEEEIFEIEEVVIVITTTTTTTTTIPIKEDFPDEEVIEVIETDPLPSDEGDEEVQLTDEEVEILVEEVEKTITEVIEVEELTEVFEENDVEIIEEEELETLSEEEVEEYVESVEEAVAEVVKELPTEKKVEVVKEVAKAKVQNLATADVQTKAVVKAVVQEVTKVETVAELDEEEKEAVGDLLGFEEETAAEDVELIAEAAAKEENIATAVEEYVERAIENADVENFTLADVVTEVQIEAFISDPVGAIIDVDLESIDFATIGQDMTSDQRQKSKEVVVPVIIASQIVAQAGALITRRPF